MLNKVLKGVVVVESPAKAKTLGSYLGDSYKVIASYGHIRDLVSKNGSVDTDDHYKMLWEFNDRGKKQIKEISDSLKQSDNLFLATDPDREGEAISWHILESLRSKKALANKNVHRVVFHEITKSAVTNAFNSPDRINQNLVDAYLARRILDYLVGFSLSPVLWRKMPGARSAGRVQSVALRLIVEREIEIQAFITDEYWSVHADFQAKLGGFTANLVVFDGTKLEKLDIKNEETASKIKSELEKKRYNISSIEKKKVKRSPYAPFTTSTLQQEAVRKLGFSAKKTMQIAQKLYEGISVDGSLQGLITYMRTDSTAMASEAVDGVREFILSEYGSSYLPKTPKVYKTKTKNAQEAHEAIRPTSFTRSPQSIRKYVSSDEFSLYELIWKRAVASQMENALIDQVSVEVVSDDGTAKFRASGSTIAFDGFLKLYVESRDDNTDEQSEKNLPSLAEGEILDLRGINCEQHFTQPPPRFNEASLVKKLEELGIGRPSTYATIINVLQERNYVSLQKRVFIPESIGFLVTSFLRNFFEKYVQYGFTADLEEELDEISNGNLVWETVLDKFWIEFTKVISKAQELTITEVINTVEKDLNDYVFRDIEETRTCPVCGKGKLHLKLGKYGAFLGCSLYPDCKFTRRLGNKDNGNNNSQAMGDMERPNKVEIGKDPNNNNDTIFLKKGPFGYYFEWEKTKDKRSGKEKKPKRLSVPKFIEDPTILKIEDAITLDNLPKTLGKHPKTGTEIQLILGRFGPYLKIGDQSHKLEKTAGFIGITLEDALKISEES
ncbi:MAG: type I DNA topoisomerase [Holosporales bacterium]|jgi:DNA topoisomerase-1|nr:type I DNA topoisomerase [Holosporales bacterium]